MATPLPLPNRRWLKIVVVELYVLSILAASALAWKFIAGKSWDWYSDRLVWMALTVAFGAVIERIGDYYAWRDKFQPMPTITTDRDEAQPARKAIDNRS